MHTGGNKTIIWTASQNARPLPHQTERQDSEGQADPCEAAPPVHTRTTVMTTATHTTEASLRKNPLSRRGESRRDHRPSHRHGEAAHPHHRGGRFRHRDPGCGCGRA